MTTWRLEWLRLLRTRRWLVLAGPFVFFGMAGPISIHYLPQLLASEFGETAFKLPKPIPAQGMAEYAEQISGIGLIIVVAAAAGALCIDATPTLATFYRTRIASVRTLLVPRYAVIALAAVISFAVGTLAAWYETTVLLGRVSASDVAVATAFGGLYLLFAVAVVAFASSLVRSTLATVGVALSLLFLLPILGIYPPAGRVLPSALAGAFGAIVLGGEAGAFLRPALLTMVLIPLLLALAVRGYDRREV
ncbi:MAG TPA: hypothetical protein VMY88_06780 [Acidimicrobiales bacterium]|nr:hypothetical protein [Acidimicrobiales bacterium]